MSGSIELELKFFASVLVTGVILGLVYDILRIVRRIVKHGVIMIAVEDAVFWMIAGVAAFCVIFAENDGNVRWFAIAGLAAGMTAYFATISRLIVKYISWILIKLKEIICKIVVFLCKPLKKIAKKIKIGIMIQYKYRKERTENYGKKKQTFKTKQ